MSIREMESAGSKIGLAGMPAKLRRPITVERIFATLSLRLIFRRQTCISPDRESEVALLYVTG